MKLYMSAKERNKKTTVGYVLLNDNDNIYTKGSFSSSTTYPPSAYVLGLKRAILFVKNNRPVKATTPIEAITDTDRNYFSYPEVQRNMKHDVFFKAYDDEILYRDKTEEDDYYLRMCQNEIKFSQLERKNDVASR